MVLAVEAELEAAYFNVRDAIYRQIIQAELGRPQSCTQIIVNITNIKRVINNKIHSKQRKAMDM